jgi:hypothetical protein
MDTNMNIGASHASEGKQGHPSVSIAWNPSPDMRERLREIDADGHSLLRDDQPKNLELKDPSIIRNPEGRGYIIYASVGRSDIQKWNIGRFVTVDLSQPWTLEQLTNLSGLEKVKDGVIVDMDIFHAKDPEEREAYRNSIKGKHWVVLKETCAPAMTCDVVGGQPLYKMYVQTACFHENGVIIEATSRDGIHFHVEPEPVVTPKMMLKESADTPAQPGTLAGVYDISHSTITWQGIPHECLTFTGTTEVEGGAVGDIYCMLRERGKEGAHWSTPVKILQQEHVPFHNSPLHKKQNHDNGHAHSAHVSDSHYEWCIEGTQIVDLGDNHYLMSGVCFLDKPEGRNGERQRVFFGASRSPLGPFVPLHTPLQPLSSKGENGHPDTVIENGTMHLVYQERSGDGKPWHLRRAEFDTAHLRELVEEAISFSSAVPAPHCINPHYYGPQRRERTSPQAGAARMA